MTGLLTADIVSFCLHTLENITISDLRGCDMKSFALTHKSKAEVGHNGYNNRIFLQCSLLLHEVRTDRHDLVAINHITILIDSEHSIRITIECDTDVSLLITNTLSELFHMGRTTMVIDIGSRRMCMDCYQICS